MRNLELDLQVDTVRSKRSRSLPTVLTREEVLAIINHLSGSLTARKITFTIR